MPKLSPATRKFLRRQQPPRIFWRTLAFMFLKALNGWMGTLNMRVYRQDPRFDPAADGFCGPVIYVFWHEYIPLPVFTRPRCNLAMLLSQHQDAEILSHIADLAGFETVRGSTNRGGSTALRELIQRGQGMSLAITPDGPRGPRRRLAQGCIYVASRLGIPICPVGVGYDRPWRNSSAWDQFAIPRPFSRCRAILGAPIYIPADLNREQVESYRVHVENTLLHFTLTAERWAEGEISLQGAEILTRACQAQRSSPRASREMPSADGGIQVGTVPSDSPDLRNCA